MTDTRRVLVIVVDGSEEMETVISVDVLRRAGVEVTMASLESNKNIKCSRGVNITADISLSDVEQQGGVYDCVLLPGGPGHAALVDSDVVGEVLKKQESDGRLIAAVCAAPMVLAKNNIGVGKTITSYPAFKDKLSAAGYKYDDVNTVVKDGNIITSRGPGTTFSFALEIVKNLVSEEKMKEVAAAMLVNI